MSMTYKEFEKYALDLKNHSDLIDDNWTICEYQNPMNESCKKYLVKKQMQTMYKPQLESDCSEFQIKEYRGPIVCEYHILYNPSYSCPDMFFNMWYTDGKLLSLEHVWCLVHSFFKEKLINDKWNAITQKEHPFNHKPFFRLHPCQNSNILETLGFLNKNIFVFNPLVTWLSTISPLVGLEVHLSYGHFHSKIVST